VKPDGEGLQPDDDLEAQVADYLLNHRDFLLRHQEVLAELELPHETGAAVSLVERQVRVLREQAQQYRRQLEELIDVARDNDQLGRRLHRLTLALIEAEEFDELVNVLQDELRDQFKADAVELKLFAAKELQAHADEPGPALFSDFMNTNKPSCGQLAKSQLEYLFGSQAGETGSAALIPLRTRTLLGVLAIGSRNPGRFNPGKGVDFLVRLGELVERTLETVSGPGN
jgi:uncharacterized protein YigA (DUF484 family)